ncbi:MAG: L-fucose/L-arabinose isomerase family protein [bacterium]
MIQTKKAKVGLLGLMLKLYDRYPHIKPIMANFANELVGVLSPFADVDFPGICNTREQVDETVSRFERQKVDLLIVVLLTYAPSHIALPALSKTKLPIMIFNTQQAYSVTVDSDPDLTFRNHGMHGVQDLANVLLRSNVKFYITTGHYKDEKALSEVRSWCDAARIVSFMRGVRIGLIGYPMEQMGDFAIDETSFLSQVGVEVQRIPMKLVSEMASSASISEVSEQMKRDRELFEVDSKVTQEAHETSSRLEWAIRNILNEKNMQGFAAHFMAIAEDGRIDTLPFLASSKLLSEGFGYGGEGDVTSSAVVTMMQELAGSANFTEMFTMDFGSNAILMSHMGEGNWKLARKDRKVRLVLDDLGIADMKMPPVLLSFSLEPGDVTIVSLTTFANGKLKFIVAEGKVLDYPPIPAINKPNYKFAPDSDLCEFLTKFSMEGASHHQALAYGRLGGTIEKIARLMGIECAVIKNQE